MTIREALAYIGADEAERLAKKYFEGSEQFPGTFRYTGAHFETLGAEHTHENQITAHDLLAVQNLSVKVPARAVNGILGEHAKTISSLLVEIPSSAQESLGKLNEERFDSVLGENSPALQLWDLLRRNRQGEHRWDVGPTTASKIMARKRPHLIPIEDSVVDRVICRGTQNSWRLWWEALSADDDLESLADKVRSHLRQYELSTLRTLDIVLWMWGKENPRA